jgi:hypothetical protein
MKNKLAITMTIVMMGALAYKGYSNYTSYPKPHKSIEMVNNELELWCCEKPVYKPKMNDKPCYIVCKYPGHKGWERDPPSTGKPVKLACEDHPDDTCYYRDGKHHHKFDMEAYKAYWDSKNKRKPPERIKHKERGYYGTKYSDQEIVRA